MIITLHRPHQIGGCITVIETDEAKIIIDLGSNLPGTNKDELTKAQVADITDGSDAIFFTHYHGDHTGLIHLVPEGIPQLIGKGAKEVMVCKHSTLVRSAKHYDGVESKKYKDAVTALSAAKRMQTFEQAYAHLPSLNGTLLHQQVFLHLNTKPGGYVQQSLSN